MQRPIFLLAQIVYISLCITACKQAAQKQAATAFDELVQQEIKIQLAQDSTAAGQTEFLLLAKKMYEQNNQLPFWNTSKTFSKSADSFFIYLNTAHIDGLFKADYRFHEIDSIYNLLSNDSIAALKPGTWASQDILFTTAFLRIVQDLKQGRLLADSLKLSRQAESVNSFFYPTLTAATTAGGFTKALYTIQPGRKEYWAMKSGMRSYADSLDLKNYTTLSYPFKDSTQFVHQLKKRLNENGFRLAENSTKDSAALADAIKTIQAKYGLKKDGKVGAALVKKLNNTDYNKFMRYALSLDKYRAMPHQMPQSFIWVNIPSYYLRVFDADSVALVSKIICGKPETATPEITSKITDMVVYPTWTVPTSIIQKEMIPGLKRNPGYLRRKGLYLVNSKNKRIDPYSVNWGKYTKGIPFMVQQGSGDGNSLGVMKFNFNNKHAVYLHDTNQRYLFSNAKRALSHGCVRVQQWRELAYFIARKDCTANAKSKQLAYNTDSLNQWLDAKRMRKIVVEQQIPVYLVYFSVDAPDGKLTFHEDVYGHDSNLVSKYFKNKLLSF